MKRYLHGRITLQAQLAGPESGTIDKHLALYVAAGSVDTFDSAVFGMHRCD